MANSTMTKVAKFNAIAKALEGVTLDGFDVQDFIAHEIEMTNKRNARKSTSPTKTQKENEGLKESILAVLADNPDGMTATEVAKTCDLSSPQKASALLRQLVTAEKVTKEKSGKAMVFMLA